MTIRIPGRQRTLGLERFFLVEDAGWMAGPVDSGARIAEVGAQIFNDLAGRGVAPLAPGLADTGPLETGIAEGETTGLDVDNRLVIASDEANTLRDDAIAPAIGSIDQAVDQAGGALSRSPAGGRPAPSIDIPIGNGPDIREP